MATAKKENPKHRLALEYLRQEIRRQKNINEDPNYTDKQRDQALDNAFELERSLVEFSKL